MRLLADCPAAITANRLALAAMAVLTGVYVFMVWRYSINVPRMDDYIQFLGYHYFFPETGAIGEKIQALLSQPKWLAGPESDHRIVFARLAMYLSEFLLGEMNFQLLTAIGNLFLFALFFLLWRATPVSVNPWAMLPVAVLLFSFVHYEASFWSSAALLYYPVTFFALATLSVLAPGVSRWRVAAGMGSGVLAVLTQANGLMVLPVAAVGALFRRRFLLAGALALLAAAMFVLYFHDFKRPGVVPPMPDVFRAAVLVLTAWFRLLGIALGQAWFLLSGFLVLAGAYLCWKRYWRINPPLFWFAVWLCVTIGSIAVGRASFGLDHLDVPRYKFYSLCLICVAYLALCEVLEAHLCRCLTWSLLLGGGVLYVHDAARNLSLAASEQSDVVHGVLHRQLEDVGPFSYGGFPTVDMAGLLIDDMRRQQRYTLPDYSERLARKLAPSPASDTPSGFGAELRALRVGRHSVGVKGFAPLEGGKCHNTEVRVFLASGEERHYFSAERLSRARWKEYFRRPCIEFASFIDARALPAGDYRLGVVLLRDGHLSAQHVFPDSIHLLREGAGS